jgi:hypothetical protein
MTSWRTAWRNIRNATRLPRVRFHDKRSTTPRRRSTRRKARCLDPSRLHRRPQALPHRRKNRLCSQPTSQTRIVAGAHSNLPRKMAPQPIFVGLCRALLDRESEAAKSGDFVLSPCAALCRGLPVMGASKGQEKGNQSITTSDADQDA